MVFIPLPQTQHVHPMLRLRRASLYTALGQRAVSVHKYKQNEIFHKGGTHTWDILLVTDVFAE